MYRGPRTGPSPGICPAGSPRGTEEAAALSGHQALRSRTAPPDLDVPWLGDSLNPCDIIPLCDTGVSLHPSPRGIFQRVLGLRAGRGGWELGQGVERASSLSMVIFQ